MNIIPGFLRRKNLREIIEQAIDVDYSSMEELLKNNQKHEKTLILFHDNNIYFKDDNYSCFSLHWIDNAFEKTTPSHPIYSERMEENRDYTRKFNGPELVAKILTEPGLKIEYNGKKINIAHLDNSDISSGAVSGNLILLPRYDEGRMDAMHKVWGIDHNFYSHKIIVGEENCINQLKMWKIIDNHVIGKYLSERP